MCGLCNRLGKHLRKMNGQWPVDLHGFLNGIFAACFLHSKFSLHILHLAHYLPLSRISLQRWKHADWLYCELTKCCCCHCCGSVSCLYALMSRSFCVVVIVV